MIVAHKNFAKNPKYILRFLFNDKTLLLI